VKLVVDASVVIPCFVPEHFSDMAATWLVVPDPLFAPDFLALECANVLWKKVRLGELADGPAKQALADITGGTIELRPSTPLVHLAFSLSRELNHSVYDCVYLALAQMEKAELVTADRVFRERAVDGQSGVWTHWIGDPIPRTR
jgi:predicted nucleic acid-binding protein